ncbi:MAG: NAD(P)-binding domain-containing protein [Planctomycetota bacterium]|nr:NAD(P)-binding domain-containing protein [Planctomycetota bacterium]
MSWIVLVTMIVVLGLALGFSMSRRRELRAMRQVMAERDRTQRLGSDKAQLQHPVVDLTRCLGCATCVAACPEDGVLELVHGQAMVVNGARCVGVSACERECPVGAITVTLGDLTDRDDVPVLSSELEAEGMSGLFLAGEITAHALIKTAVDQGTAVGREVARRTGLEGGSDPDSEVLDLCIVGAGPAGLACSMVAKQGGLRFAMLDQEQELGGTVAKYPRRKLVMSMPMEMPGYGKVKKQTYEKEELMELWQDMASSSGLELHGGQVLQGVERSELGHFVVQTATHEFKAKHVCLALGRRGIPRKLGVPGEELPKVAYHLIDAHSYQGRRILVVGGGDSAVEAAMALAEQPGNEVSLSYRKEGFFRIRSKNEARIKQCIERGTVQVYFQSELTAITADSVRLQGLDAKGNKGVTLPNDEVFLMVGGVPPFETLKRSGVSFDASQHAPVETIGEQGSGLTNALLAGLCSTLVVLLFVLWHNDYYGLQEHLRPAHPKHDLLAPAKGMGLGIGILACVLVVVNLLYLLRRSPRVPFRLGSLQHWMTGHVATGIGALLCALLHSGLAPKDTTAGHALLALGFLLVTGSVGRYLYAYVPRAANGRELELHEVTSSLGQLAEEWDQGHREFRQLVRGQVMELIEQARWKGSFLGRAASLALSRWKLRGRLHRLEKQGADMGVDAGQVHATLSLARSAHRSATMATHFEDLRALMGTWRYLHRWVAALMVLLVIAHVAFALYYGFSLSGDPAGSTP